MSRQFVGEIRILACESIPIGCAPCNGQYISIAQNTKLFAQMGTNYGGGGELVMLLPFMNERCAVGVGEDPSDRLHFEARFNRKDGSTHVALNFVIALAGASIDSKQ